MTEGGKTIPVPTEVMGTDTESGRQVYVAVTRGKDGVLMADAQKFGLRAFGKDTKELLTAFETEYNKKFK